VGCGLVMPERTRDVLALALTLAGVLIAALA
jgi:hypothetical protein